VEKTGKEVKERCTLGGGGGGRFSMCEGEGGGVYLGGGEMCCHGSLTVVDAVRRGLGKNLRAERGVGLCWKVLIPQKKKKGNHLRQGEWGFSEGAKAEGVTV